MPLNFLEGEWAHSLCEARPETLAAPSLGRSGPDVSPVGGKSAADQSTGK